MRNMAKKRAPVEVVETTTMFPIQLMHIKQIMWIDRSPVFPLVHVTRKDTSRVRNQTGTVNKSVLIGLNPRVLTIEGKKYWNVCVRSERCWSRMKKYRR